MLGYMYGSKEFGEDLTIKAPLSSVYSPILNSVKRFGRRAQAMIHDAASFRNPNKNIKTGWDSTAGAAASKAKPAETTSHVSANAAGENPEGRFSKVADWAKRHPVATAAGGATTGGFGVGYMMAPRRPAYVPPTDEQ